MSSLSPVNPSSQTFSSVDLNYFLSKNNPPIENFDAFIDRMVSQNSSQHPALETTIQYQQKLEEFKHKLAVLSSMVEQAQIVMNARETGVPANEQEYFYLKSKLSQVGLPDGTNNLI